MGFIFIFIDSIVLVSHLSGSTCSGILDPHQTGSVVSNCKIKHTHNIVIDK